ncbi:hypothetical protein AMECASPLE_006000 [Ameca splendens]|uniref:Eyes absent homolog n=1 Tax=Ameca splendens TaxID=208324 RepID=A0ABV0XCE3_9TELE
MNCKYWYHKTDETGMQVIVEKSDRIKKTQLFQLVQLFSLTASHSELWITEMAAYGQTQYSPALQPAGPYTAYTHHTQGYGMPSYNIKTEDGLSHSPGQTGLLGYSNFSGTPPSQSLYSYSHTHGQFKTLRALMDNPFLNHI